VHITADYTSTSDQRETQVAPNNVHAATAVDCLCHFILTFILIIFNNNNNNNNNNTKFI